MRLQLQLFCAADKRPAPQGGSVPLNRRQAHCCRQVSEQAPTMEVTLSRS